MKTQLLAFLAAMGLGASANAALVDFTVPELNGGVTPSAAVTVDGVTFTLTANPAQLNFNDSITNPAGAACSILACANDGAGVADDELTGAEVLTLTISEAVNITGLYFLDLFFDPSNSDQESAIVDFNGDGADVELFANEMYSASENGFAFFMITDPDAALTSLVVFTVGALNDGIGRADYAFAGLTFEKIGAPEVPVPAALPLLLSGIAGLGFASRRRRRAKAA